MPNNNQPKLLTADALSSLTGTRKTQLQDWLERPQTHERLGAEGKSAQHAAKMEAFLQDIEKKMTGNTT